MTIDTHDETNIDAADETDIDPDTTEATDETSAAAEPVEAAEATQGAEAAKYRRKLRETETERDGLLTQLEAMRRAEVGRLVTEQRVWQMKPAALWAAGTDLAGLLAEDGSVDAEKVTAAIAVAAEILGSHRIPSAPSAYGQGNVGKPIGYSAGVASWQEALASR